MRTTSVTKIEEGSYEITSLACPKCDGVMSVTITGQELFRINQGELNVLAPRLSPEERERFISGYCPTCWVALFGEDEDDECETDGHTYSVDSTGQGTCMLCGKDQFSSEEDED